MSKGTERPKVTRRINTMMNLTNTVNTANLSVILAEDVYTPELRNPKLSGMSKTRMNLFNSLIKAVTARK
jgi:hypothetical protein